MEYKRESYELFTAMMDRMEDETVRFLYFLQVHSGYRPGVPYPEEDEEAQSSSRRRRRTAERARRAEEEKKLAAKTSIEDFTRNIQRKKDKELAALQFGGDGSTGTKTVAARRESGPQRSLPVRQRQEVQKVPRRGVGNQ